MYIGFTALTFTLLSCFQKINPLNILVVLIRYYGTAVGRPYLNSSNC